MLSADMRRDGRRVGFELMNIMTGEKGILAHIEQDGPRVGKYGVNLGDLDRIGVKAIGDALRADLIVIDEIAPMELRSEGFIMAVSRAMESDKPMLVALHQRSNHELVKRIRSAFDVIEITDENRDEIPNMIIERIRSR
jgi:nucleoside-triphosphatase